MRQAAVHVEDRGFQFADSVYEVCEVKDGAAHRRGAPHATRLQRSLEELGIPRPLTRRALGHIMRQCIARNRVRNGVLYLQVSRGAAPRDFASRPRTSPRRSCAWRARPIRPSPRRWPTAGIAVKTLPEMRWGRCDIKTVMLLPACLAKEAARPPARAKPGSSMRRASSPKAHPATPGSSMREGKLITRPHGREILPGVTRATLLDLIARDKHRRRGEGLHRCRGNGRA